jgi:hypothetical protein
MRSHTIIAGTGRAGTTFLVHLLTALNVDTGFSLDEIPRLIDPRSHAGLEWDPRQPNAPYLVKSPSFYLWAKEVFENPDISIDHVFIPIRDMTQATLSRISVANLSKNDDSDALPIDVPGGLVDTDSPKAQGNILSDQLIDLLLEVARHNIPVTLIHFPTSLYDSEYLFKKLKPILAKINYEEFQKQFDLIADPGLVSQFPSTLTKEPVEQTVATLLKQNYELNNSLAAVAKSYSWRPTKPLRRIKAATKKWL